jgi:antitoxin (DNA-binding transcriptional repressor) of toxin-antitoxin stability system
LALAAFKRNTNVIRIRVKEAEGNLRQLVEQASSGEDVVIFGARGSAVRLVPVRGPEPTEAEPASTKKTVGHGLDRFVGTWSEEQEAELLQSVAVFEHVDESFWE